MDRTDYPAWCVEVKGYVPRCIIVRWLACPPTAAAGFGSTDCNGQVGGYNVQVYVRQ